MTRARRIWKWSAVIVGTIVVLLAIAVGSFRLWLEHSPEVAPQIVARVARLTGLEFSFARLDARLGLDGPELVFSEARVMVPGQHDALLRARAGRVGFDLWRALFSWRLASARVVLDEPQVYVYLTKDGIELRGQGANAGAHLTLEQLPVGHLRIEDATVTVQDLRGDAAPWRIDRVSLDVERDQQELRLNGRVRLPDALGAHLDLDLKLRGDLAAVDALDWQAEAVLQRASIAGWTALLPQWPWLPSGGHGNLSATLAGRGAVLARADLRLDLEEVVTAVVPGRSRASLQAISGVLNVVHDAGGWRASGRDLTIDPGHDAWRRGEFDFALDWPESGLAGVSLRSPAIRLDALAALVPLLPEGAVREALTQLAPRGALTVVELRALRGPRPGEWQVNGGARFTGLGLGAWRALPGFASIDGDLVAAGAGGRAHLRSGHVVVELPELLRVPVEADALAAQVDYWWQPDGWRFAASGIEIRSRDGRAGGAAHLWLPADAELSPRLVLDLRVAIEDVSSAPKYLPSKLLPPHTVDWLDHAFIAGRIPEARLEFVGETRRFPFRDGGGLFRVRLPYEGIRLHYQDGFADIEGASGDAEFRNEGFSARARSAHIAGLAISGAAVRMADFLEAELTASAHAEGDARDALAFLQSSPVGPRLGEFFMGVRAQGPLSTQVALDFPIRNFAARTINVDGRLERLRARLPGLDDEFTEVEGAFTLHDRELDAPQLTATVLGGPARIRARTIAGPTGKPGDRVLLLEAQGRATAEHLQPLVGITKGAWLHGALDWKAVARLPRLEWRPESEPVIEDAARDTRPQVNEWEFRWLPATVHAEASLGGLEVGLPAPLAKATEDARAFKADVTVDPGLVAGAAPLPPQFRRRDAVRPVAIGARVQLGRDASVFELRPADSGWRLARGTLRFGGGVPQLRDDRGLWLEGRIADVDLSAWLALQLSEGASRGVSEYLRGGTLAVDRFAIFGYHFADLTVALESRDHAWHAQVDGPAAKGAVVVPWVLPGAAPIAIDLERLVLGERDTAAVAAAADRPTDPAELPALVIRVQSLEIQKRHFGSLEADVTRIEHGLELTRATLNGRSFEASATGSWLSGAGGQASALKFSLSSTDLRDSLSAWGFAPSLTARAGHASGELRWPGGIDGDLVGRISGSVKMEVEKGQLTTVDPGAGRVLGLMSLSALPRRLTLDFSDLTDKGFAFDSIRGDFDFKDGNAYTSNLVLKGPAAEIGVIGRTGFQARDYDQTAKVTGHIGGPLAAAGALAGGPAVGAALLLFSTVFKEPLSGFARGYYRITGSWDTPKVERIDAGRAREANQSVGETAPQ